MSRTKKPKLMMHGHSDEMHTPKVALHPLLPFLKNNWRVWECAWGKGALAQYLSEDGFEVIGKPEVDFLAQVISNYYDCIVTNPPYSKKDEFLKRCYEMNKPFALLLPLTALEGRRRGVLYRKYGIQLIIPNKRINFVTPSGKGSGSWFQVAWFTWGLNLPKDLMFVDLEQFSKEELSKKIDETLKLKKKEEGA